jgi:hypothetical protein
LIHIYTLLRPEPHGIPHFNALCGGPLSKEVVGENTTNYQDPPYNSYQDNEELKVRLFGRHGTSRNAYGHEVNNKFPESAISPTSPAHVLTLQSPSFSTERKLISLMMKLVG